MTQNKPKRIKWTVEKIWEVARQYDDLSTFIKEQKSCYEAAIRRKINKDVTKHMSSIYFWNFDLAVTEASKYSNRSDFHKSSPGAAAWAYRNKCLQDVLDAAGLGSKYAEDGSYTKDRILEIAESCECKNDFRKNYSSAYVIAKRDGYLTDCDQFWVPARTYWTDEMLALEALKYPTKSAFKVGNNSAYAICRKRGIIDLICKHMVRPEKQLKWDIGSLRDEALKYTAKIEFLNTNPGAYKAAKEIKVLDEICEHMLNSNTRWTNEKMFDAAKNCTSRIDFLAKHPGAHARAVKLNILDEVCSHMGELIRWSFESVTAEASKHETRADFQRGSSGAYQYALKKQIIDDICGHMIDGSPSDNDAIYIWKADMTFNELNIYKIGITSHRLGDWRIKHVASEAGFTAQIIKLCKVTGKASEIEKQLKKIGLDPKLEKFDGSTEFRAWTDQELILALDYIKQHQVKFDK